jgi:serine/threonine protein kinase
MEQIAEGGQSWVYEVRDLTNVWVDRAVLKRLKNHDRLNRFDREIKATQALDHPSIAKIVDYSLEEPAFYVSPHYEGRSLRSIAPLNTIDAIDLFIAICDPIAYAHAKGVIHRDLKPDNIILKNGGQVVIVDFGLCYFEDDERLTETMEQVGSRFYMAPEMEAGRAQTVTPLVDVYSLGKLLYFLLSNRDLHRESYSGENNLVSILGNKQLDYLNQFIFPVSVESDARKRVPVAELMGRTRVVRRLVEEHFYPGREGSKCRFCGIGEYGRTVPTRLRVRELGIETNRTYETVVCNQCGNLQWFVSQSS